ncbi:MAG: MBOAT family protein [Clostridia bacterium]|nr:MBOAT family protein [Clostridia bacterium]
MVFSSLIFICIFLPAMLVTYNLSKNITYKNIILAAASLIFYAWGEPVWVILLLISAITDYIHGLIIDRFYATPIATAAMISSLIINLGMLVIFKYSGFLVENINNITGISLPVPQFALPVGISFYTFQTLSYTIDLYRGKTHVQKSPLRFLIYVSMFPQLVAGPIVRYDDIAPYLKNRRATMDDMAYGIKRFTSGLLKKLALANAAGDVAGMLLEGTRLTVATSWLGMLMFTFQIYFDFSGYSDMAIGLGRMLGFKFKENFDYPYISKNITEFWRRWHISLSSFFRDYVYIPLGGNRYKHIRNLFIVWLLTGLWHGASWNFIIWGLFYGVILFIEKTLFNRKLLRIPSPFCHIYTMVLVMLGWAIFYFTDINALAVFIKGAFGIGSQLYDLTSVSAICTNLWLIIICVIGITPVPTVIYTHLCKQHKKFAAVTEPVLVGLGLLLCFILLVGQTYNPFLYFRF